MGSRPTEIRMAGRRLAKSAVDWAAFAERVPKYQIDAFRSLKAKNDTFVSTVHKYPESLPAIDFSAYKSRIAMPGLVDTFEKAYAGVTVPYPAGPDNLKAGVDKQEVDSEATTAEFCANVQRKIDNAKAVLDIVDSIPSPEVMTQEMYAEYFPERARNPEKPTFFPHTYIDQPGNDPMEIGRKKE